MRKHDFLPHVTRPGRYIGGEFNAIEKSWEDSQVRFALVFPDLYEIGMSHFGLQILYHLLNKENHILAERCYTPDIDAEKVMVEKNIPLLSLESGKPLQDFDIIGITLPYELCYTNILTVLDLAGIPFYSHQRNDDYPIILGGGSCSLNPEPVAPYFDAILLGDGEEAILEIAEVIRHAKKSNWGKNVIFSNLYKIDGIYIPADFTPEYDADSRISRILPRAEHRQKVERRILKDLDSTTHLLNPIVPHAKVVHDRLGIEIARGCTRGCRFCQAGMIYRPVRERSIDQIMELAEQGIDNSGFEELALLSLSTGDHSCINEILPNLMDRFASRQVSVSMPSMRVGTLSQNLMNQIKRVRKTGFTVAPEAGSERLRRVINKGISEEDLLKTCADAFNLGWKSIKLYFMIGLPTETDDDIAAIADLAKKIKNSGSADGNRRKQITTSVGTFVPKPHTPFQWHEQISLAESRKKIQHLKDIMPRKGIKLKWHDPEMSFLEGVFSRGDRRLSQLIESAWSKGARLDGWSDHFRLEIWHEAAEQCDLDLDFYLRAREIEEILPWQHLLSGVDPDFLLAELDNGLSETYTPDCRYHNCQNCGLCDFDTLMPVVHEPSPIPQTEAREDHNVKIAENQEQHFKYMVNYSRTGDICYLGHLEILQLIFRALRRAQIRTNFSKGFNPSPKISFSGALPVGMESEAEFFIMDLPEPLEDPSQTIVLLNKNLPNGISVNDIEIHSGKIAQSIAHTYLFSLNRALSTDEKKRLDSYLSAPEYFISRVRKGKEKQIDIRPLLTQISIENDSMLLLELISISGVPGVKAEEALMHIFSFSKKDMLEATIKKTSWKQLNTA